MDKLDLKDLSQAVKRWLTGWYPLVGLVLFIIILVFGYGKLIKPLINEIFYLQKNQLEKRLENKDAIIYGQVLEKFIKTSKQYEADNAQSLEKLSSFLPEQPTIPQLFTLFDYFFTENGFEVKDLSFEVNNSFASEDLELQYKDGNSVRLPALDPSVGVINVSVNLLGGGYEQLKTMLGNLEKIGRIVDMSNLNIESVPANKTDQSYSLQLRTYYYKGN